MSHLSVRVFRAELGLLAARRFLLLVESFEVEEGRGSLQYRYGGTPIGTSPGLDAVRQSRAKNTKKEIPGIELKARAQNHFPLPLHHPTPPPGTPPANVSAIYINNFLRYR
jgi:hypothetical protein